MKNVIKIFVLILIVAAGLCGCNRDEAKYTEITDTSNLYQFDGATVVSKMRSNENGNHVYAMDVKYNGKTEYVFVTKDEYDSFELDDTIKVVKNENILFEEANNGNTETTNGYKIVTIGGENYLVIKLESNISVNDTSKLK